VGAASISDAERCGRGRDLHADQPGADDRQAFDVSGQQLAQRACVVDRAQLAHRVAERERRQPPRLAAGRHHELPIAQARTVLEVDPPRGRVKR
jgi:hypothetical protein